MIKLRFFVFLLLFLGFNSALFTQTTKYLPGSTILYVEADLYNLDILLKDLIIQFYSKEHYKQLKAYFSETSRSELGIDITKPGELGNLGIDFKKKAILALLAPTQIENNFVVGVHIKNREVLEKSVENIYNHFFPKMKIRDELKPYGKRKKLKELFKEDFDKMVFEKRIKGVSYKGFVIKTFKRKVKNYRNYYYREVFSYVIFDKIIFFGKSRSLRALINAYIYKEGLHLNKDLQKSFKELGKDNRIKAYFSLDSMLKFFGLKPISKNTVLTLAKGIGFALKIDKNGVHFKTRIKMNQAHPKYKKLIQGLYALDNDKGLFQKIPKNNFSFVYSQMDYNRLKILNPLYKFILPITRIAGIYSPHILGLSKTDFLFLRFLRNSKADSAFILYKPRKKVIETVDYHPHKLDFIYYTRVIKTSLAYNLIDTLLHHHLKDKNSVLKEEKIKGQFFYFFTSKNLKLCVGVYKKILIITSKRKRLLAFIANIEKNEKNEKKGFSNKAISKNLKRLNKKRGKVFFTAFLDFSSLPSDIEVFDKKFKPLKQIQLLYVDGFEEKSFIKGDLYIKFKKNLNKN